MTIHYKQALSLVIIPSLFLILSACDSDSGLVNSNTNKKYSEATDVKVEKMTQQTQDEELAPLFIPSLSAILLAAEKEKGSPLSKEEVLNIRDNSNTIMTPKSLIESMAEERGYIDPENCWNEWQILRKSLNKENEEANDHEAVVIESPSDNPAMRNAEEKARETLDQFRQIMKKHPDINPMIKVRIEDINASSRMWLFVDKVEPNGFKAHLFEVPSGFEKYQAGDSFTIKDTDILDWMINNNGEVNGAYTIRVQRESMSEKERKEMDEYMGIDKYL